MAIKFIVGAIGGTMVGAGITYYYMNRERKEVQEKIDQYKAKCADLNAKYEESSEVISVLRTTNELKNNIINSEIDALNRLADVNMYADISAINNIEIRNKCFEFIDMAKTAIKDHCGDPENFDSNIIENIISDMESKIKNIIMNYDEEEDEDEITEDNAVVSPKAIVLKAINNRKPKIFNTTDIEFEIIDGSDTENNEYHVSVDSCVELYNFLFNTIKPQLHNQYAFKIDADAFDAMIDGMEIFATLSFINDDVMEIKQVHAYVPFEVFENEGNFYYIEGGEILHGDIIEFSKHSASGINIQNKQSDSDKGGIKKTEPPKTQKMVIDIDLSLSEENAEFLVSSINFNKEALKYFFAKLAILQKVNVEAYDAISTAFKDILHEIYIHKNNETLDDNTKRRYSTGIQALINNLKKNYGNVIKNYNT